MTYEQVAQQIRRHPDEPATSEKALLTELVRYATLAPSSHNTQCWRFLMGDSSVSILPDFDRRCPVVDPDDHHLFVSLGCAAENLVHAARASGLEPTVDYDLQPDGGLKITLEPFHPNESELYHAILKRQCTRAEYDGKALSNDELFLLKTAGRGRGVRVEFFTHRPAMETVLDYVVQGNTAQMHNPGFVKELKSWIRFSDAEAIAAGDGLSGKVSGKPSVPRWIGSPLFNILFRTRPENDKYARQIRSSAGIAVFVSDKNDRAHWMEAGRCYERFALQATALGIRNAFVNQPVEEAGLRPLFASALGLGDGRPNLVVRFGRGPEMPKSLRRPVSAVVL